MSSLAIAPGTARPIRSRTSYEGATATAAMPGEEFKAMNGAGLKQIPWTLWLDDRGLPHKYTTALHDKRGEQVRITVTYSKWGVPVDIKPPPADQVATLRG